MTALSSPLTDVIALSAVSASSFAVTSPRFTRRASSVASLLLYSERLMVDPVCANAEGMALMPGSAAEKPSPQADFTKERRLRRSGDALVEFALLSIVLSPPALSRLLSIGRAFSRAQAVALMALDRR